VGPAGSRLPGAVILGSDFKALGVVRSLGRRGIPSVVVDDLPRAAWYSRYVLERYRWQGAMWGPEFLDFLLGLPARGPFQRWVLMPMQDEVVELVARHTPLLAKPYRLVTPGWETLRWAHDKRLAYSLATEIEIPVPATWYPDNEQDLTRLGIRFPAIVKPRTSIRLQHALGRKALPANGAADLVAQYRRAAAVSGADTLMVQEVIPGNGKTQHSVAAFCKDGELLAAMTARRTRQYPVDYGLSSSFVEAIDVPGLIDLAQRLIHRIRLSGMVEVEFKYDARDGLHKLLDVNVRPWGWHTLCAACGLDFPYIQYCDALGLNLALPRPSYGYRWRRLITDLAACATELRRGTSTPAFLVRSLSARAVASVFDVSDPVPAFADAVIAVSRSLKPGSRGRAPIGLDETPPLPAQSVSP
jgi:predicted ATP-grasp superfamily ATP-dependent carboligase